MAYKEQQLPETLPMCHGGSDGRSMQPNCSKICYPSGRNKPCRTKCFPVFTAQCKLRDPPPPLPALPPKTLTTVLAVGGGTVWAVACTEGDFILWAASILRFYTANSVSTFIKIESKMKCVATWKKKCQNIYFFKLKKWKCCHFCKFGRYISKVTRFTIRAA